MGSILQSAGNVAGGVIGDIASGGQRGQATDFTNQAVGALQGVQLPTNLANQIYYQQYQNAGQLTPAMQQMIAASPSLQAQVKANPQLVAAQMQALNQLQQTSQNGMTASSQNALNQIQQQLNTNAQGQKQAAMQNFAQRGQAGSGNELLAELNAGQNAANQANQSGLGVAANAQQNALNALSQYGNQAGAMNTQQYGQQSQAAQAADALNRFNTQNQLQVQAGNVQAQNAANQYNVQNAQQLANANVAQTNAGYNQQKAEQQQLYNDALSKATNVAGAEFTGANAYNNMANQTSNMWGNIGAGAGGLAGGAYNASSSSPSGSGSLDSSNASNSQLMNQAYGYAHGGPVDGSNTRETSINSGGAITPYGGGGQTFADGGPVQQGFTGSLTAPTLMQNQQQQNDPVLQQYMNSGKDQSMMTGGIVPGYFVGGNVTGNQKPEDFNPLLGPAVEHQDTDMNNPVMNLPSTRAFAQGGLTSPTLTSASNINTNQGDNTNGGSGDMMSMLPVLAMLASKGGHVPGKALVKGDSYRNDLIPAKLSAGEIVLPRSVTQSSDAAEKAKWFVKRIKEGKKH